MTISGNLDRSIRESLSAFADAVLSPDWRGREREAISLYTFRYLLPHFNGRLPLRDPAQLGIEVCVPGVAKENPKGRVNKDLVIWPFSAMSCWNEHWEPEWAPRCILEWTLSRTGARWQTAWRYDLEWLQAFTAERQGCVGFAVAIVTVPRSPFMRVARVQRGHSNPRWLERTPFGAA